jgi:hypothetical protein
VAYFHNKAGIARNCNTSLVNLFPFFEIHSETQLYACLKTIVRSPRDLPYGDKHLLSVLEEVRSLAPVRASPSMLSKCLSPYNGHMANLSASRQKFDLKKLFTH